MVNARYNLVIYIGSGEEGRRRRIRFEEKARSLGYINRKGEPKIGPYIVDHIEGNIKQRAKRD